MNIYQAQNPGERKKKKPTSRKENKTGGDGTSEDVHKVEASKSQDKITRDRPKEKESTGEVKKKKEKESTEEVKKEKESTGDVKKEEREIKEVEKPVEQEKPKENKAEESDDSYDESKEDISKETSHEEVKELIKTENPENKTEIKEEKVEETKTELKSYADELFLVPDQENTLVMASNDNPYQIKGATIHKLIERLTSPSDAHAAAYDAYIATFFMTYRSFATPTIVLDLIIRRYKGPENLNLEEAEKWDVPFSMIRRGACRALVHWFTNHYRDFSKDSKLKKTLLDFQAWALENDPPSKNNLVGYLVKMLDKKNDKGTYTSLFDSGIMVDKDVCPDPVIPKSWQNITFMDLDDREIARQLSISQHHIYAEIQPEELQDLAWSKSKTKSDQGLLLMIDQFNKFSNAVSSMLVTTPKLKLRKKLIEKLIRIASFLMEINSFDMVMAIISGFQNAAAHRLKFSFEAVSKKTTETLEQINTLFSSQNSYKAYREMLNKVAPPAIPFLGVYLSDLTFIDEGNPKLIGEHKLVNFRKKQLEYDVIIQVLKYQDRAYQFKLVHQFKSIFESLPRLNDKELYENSLLIEPRKAKKKDIK